MKQWTPDNSITGQVQLVTLLHDCGILQILLKHKVELAGSISDFVCPLMTACAAKRYTGVSAEASKMEPF